MSPPFSKADGVVISTLSRLLAYYVRSQHAKESVISMIASLIVSVQSGDLK